jgi:ACR3 family arsenite transporter
VWVFLCIGAGIALGRLFPEVAVRLDAISIYQVSIPIVICLFFMMYPIMVKIDFTQAANAVRTPKPVILTIQTLHSEALGKL